MRVKFNESPFYLNEESVQWVKEQYHRLSLDEKLAQLIFYQPKQEDISHLAKEIGENGVGGVVLTKDTKEALYEKNRFLQTHFHLPCFISGRVLSGPNNLITEGSFVGSPLKIAATQDQSNAYQLAWLTALEWSAVGGNMLFAPNISQLKGEEASRWLGTKEEQLDYISSYWQGTSEHDVLAVAYPFPCTAYELPEWRQRIGCLIRQWIKDDGAALFLDRSAFPTYIAQFSQDPTEQKRPSYYSTYITEELLRKNLQYEGLIIANIGQKKEAMAYALALGSGCDMIYTQEAIPTVLADLKAGLGAGLFTEHQLHQRVERILALKASLGFCAEIPFMNACSRKTQLAKIHQERNQLLQAKIADAALTLCNDQGLVDQHRQETLYFKALHREDDSFVQALLALWQEPKYQYLRREEAVPKGALCVYVRRQDKELPKLDETHSVILTCTTPFYPQQEIYEEIITYDDTKSSLRALLEKLKRQRPFLGHLPEIR